MSKVELLNIVKSGDVSLLNTNFDRIQAEFQNKVLYRDNPENEPNTLETDVDCNGKRLYNLPEPISPHDAARLQDIISSKVVEDVLDASERAADAAERAEAASEIAEAASERADQIMNLSIAVNGVPHGEVASGSYNPETGMLTLRVPEGPQGNSGFIVDMQGIFGFEIRGGDLFLVYDEVGTAPDFYIDENGYLIWQA